MSSIERIEKMKEETEIKTLHSKSKYEIELKNRLLTKETIKEIHIKNKFKKRIKYKPVYFKLSQTLDTPCIKDDFYNNLMDVYNKDLLAVILDSDIHLKRKKNIIRIKSSKHDGFFHSLRFFNHNVLIATNENYIYFHDLKNETIFKTTCSDDKITCISHRDNIISMGTNKGNIEYHDIRIKNGLITKSKAHESFVCGLSWGERYLASGDTDGVVSIYDKRHEKIVMLNEHTSTVKAMNWCPWNSNLLVTGGGISDMNLCFWNVENKKCTIKKDTSAQITSVSFSNKYQFLLSTHGGNGNIYAWDIIGTKVGLIKGPSARILYSNIHHDFVFTLCANETIKIFEINAEKLIKKQSGSSLENSLIIR